MTAPEETGPPLPKPMVFDGDDPSIDRRLALRNTFSETLASNGFHDVLVLSRERAGDVFHERRLEILDYLRTAEPDSVRDLAAGLGYDKGVVSRDLQRLASIDVIEYEDGGRSKAPRLAHRHVVVEPIV